MKHKIEKILIVAVLSIFFAGTVRADLAKKINGIIQRPSQKKTQFSVKIIKANSGKTIYSHNSAAPMMPASNMKIIISAAALKYLGPDYEYKTKIGFCDNTLVVLGGGDPLLGDKKTDEKYGRETGWIFDDIATALKQRGIKSIDDIIVDTSIFDDERVHINWPVEQLNRNYACEVSGLNFNGNCIDVTTKNSGGKVSVYVSPKTDYVKITNKLRAISSGRGAVGAYRQPGKPNHLIVKGKCRNQQGPFAVAIERPAVFFGFLLYENLLRAGINVNGQLIENIMSKDCKFKLLLEHRTSIIDCLKRCNSDSFGLSAESLLKTIAAHVNSDNKDGSWKAGRKVLDKYLTGLGIDRQEFYIDDGSGLSKQNRLSANAITEVLFSVYKSKLWGLYKESLAIGGATGTVRKYFKDKKHKGRIFGKTGYIAGAKSFSGVCDTSNGDVIFSILTNKANGKTRTAINDIAKAIISEYE